MTYYKIWTEYEGGIGWSAYCDDPPLCSTADTAADALQGLGEMIDEHFENNPEVDDDEEDEEMEEYSEEEEKDCLSDLSEELE